jgi:HK97 family phage major capsid protein
MKDKSPSKQIAAADDKVRATQGAIEAAVQKALQTQSAQGHKVIDPREDPNFRKQIESIDRPFGAERTSEKTAVRQSLRGQIRGMLQSDAFRAWAAAPDGHRPALAFSLPNLGRTQAAGYDDIREADVLVSERADSVPWPTTQQHLRNFMTVVPLTEGNSITYLRQTGFVNAAVAVAATIDPASPASSQQSSITSDIIVEPVHAILAHIPIPRTSIEDIPGLEQDIEDQLIPAGYDKETQQYLFGAANPFTGLLAHANRQNYVESTDGVAGDNRADSILRMMTMIWVSRLAPDTNLMSIQDRADLMLEKDDFGRYLFGDPTSSTILSKLWGIPLAGIYGMTNGTAASGAFRTAAKIRDRMEASVVFSETVASAELDQFVYALFRMRTGLQNSRPEAFCKGTLDGAPGVAAS